MMPDDLWKPLSEHEIRSLVSYLASPAQVPLPPAEPAKRVGKGRNRFPTRGRSEPPWQLAVGGTFR